MRNQDMEHFLSLAAADLTGNFVDATKGLSHITVVFPNRRARLFFDEYLTLHNDKPVWSPVYMTISDLFQSQTSLRIADRNKLVSLLYNIYKDVMNSDETLDSFWNWGELMLDDFDDIDRNMADADAIFACLENHKEIAAKPFLSEEQSDILKEFFDHFNGSDTELRVKYSLIWNRLGLIYNRFRTELMNAGLAYEGMLQREVASGASLKLPEDGLCAFIGFNSLDKAERTVFRRLKECGKALFYWDYDKSYIEDPSLEAGLFMRDNLAEFPNRLNGSLFDNINKDKELTIIETSSDTAQAGYIPDWIAQIDGKPGKDTAIVLCDGSLLQPVINAIPTDSTEGLNITMGFPFKATPLYSFISAILDTQRSILRNGGRLTLDMVGRVLNNPITNMICGNAADTYQELIKSHRYYPDINEINAGDTLSLVFRASKDNLSLLDKISEIIQVLAPVINGSVVENVFQPLYCEALYRIYTNVSRMRTLIEEGSLDISTDMLCKLLRKIMAGTTVPFHGEPVAGMQVMGLIETRNLDFKHILLLSASEGTLPSGNGGTSFIPYSIRAAFGLTTMRERSAVAAYNFHHLLQRAESVTMVYNSNADQSGIGKGQISRYLLQLIVSGRPIRRLALSSDHCEQTADRCLSSGKSTEVMRRLYGMYDTSDTSKYISPSAINCYLDCKYKYYLRYVAGIQARQDDPSGIEANLFGTLFHDSAELAYNALAEASPDRTITKSMLEKLAKDKTMIESFVREAFKKDLFDGKDISTSDYNGTQSVNFEVVCRYLYQTLKTDMIYAPFVYVGSEAAGFSHLISLPHPEYPGKELNVRISGRIDRIDLKDGIYRIADYKTGHVEKDPKCMDDLFCNSDNRCGYALQTFYYATLVHNAPGYGDKRLAPVLLYLRRTAKPTADNIYMRMDNVPVTDFAASYMDEYGKRLRETIMEIFDRNVPFAQTDVRAICAKCDFRELCMRKSDTF